MDTGVVMLLNADTELRLEGGGRGVEGVLVTQDFWLTSELDYFHMGEVGI